MSKLKSVNFIIATIVFLISLIMLQDKAYAQSEVLYCSSQLYEVAPVYSKVTIDRINRNMSVLYHDETQEEGSALTIGIYNRSNYRIGDRKSMTYVNHEGTLDIDYSSFPDGAYLIECEYKTENKPTGGELIGKKTLLDVDISAGNVKLGEDYASHSHETEFINSINASRNPELYNGFAAVDYISNTHLEDMIALSNEITRDCRSDAEKVRAIHDWVCSNVAYDYTCTIVDPDTVYEIHRAVCSGYSRFGRILFLAAGIPCLDVEGHLGSEHIDENIEGPEDISANHEWNIVYLNGSWMPIDMTSDAGGKYYGENSSKNVSACVKRWTYFAPQLNEFGYGSYSIELAKVDFYSEDDPESYNYVKVTGITLCRDTTELRIKKGSTVNYETTCSIYGVRADGRTVTDFYIPIISITPIDTSTVGTKPVTVTSRGGFTLTYNVEIYDASNSSGNSSNSVSSFKSSKVVISKKSAIKKGLNLSWKKLKNAKKYYIQVSKNKNFKDSKQYTTTKTSITIKKLKAKKNYYVRVRASGKINNTSCYSKWSKTYKIKTK